jgi:carboxyl-terminal processing protease
VESNCKGNTLAGRVVRVAAALAGVGLVVWILLFSGIYPRQTVFELGAAGEASASEYRQSDLARLRLLTICIGYIRSQYVVPERVKPMPMMAGALKAAEALVPDLMVSFNAADPEKATSVEVRIGDLTKIFPLEKMSDLYQMNWRLVDMFEFISSHLPSDVKPEEVEYAAINGMLQPLDEHSMYLPPDAYEQMQLDTQGRFGGLGIVISSRGGYVTVMSVMEDTPAWRAALKTGDQIIEINEESTMNMPLTEAVSKLRGDPGTKVSLVVDRKGWSDPRTIAVERAEIKVQSVKTQVLGNGIGYAKLVHFQEDTAAELSRQLEDLRRRGSLKGLVLDMRQNPGGLLDQAVEVGDLFLKSGTLVVTEGEGSRLRQAFEADRGDAFENLPTVVLVDGGSASAAEIVAGALKYNDRAMLIGSTTFGKGTVQVMHEVGEGALKLTVAQYLIPGDLSIQGVGVVPDLELVPTSIGKKNILMGLTDYKRFMDPKRRLDAFGEIAADIPVQVIPYLVKSEEEDQDEDNDVLEELPVEDDAFKRDEAIDLAASIVSATVTFADSSRKAQLKNGHQAAVAWKNAQDLKISSSLVGRGVDWASGPVVESPSVAIGFSAGNAALVAGTSATMNMSVTNRGDKPMFRVRASIKSDNLVIDGREFIFGRIDPGSTVSRQIHFKVPRETWERRDQVELFLYQNAVDGIPSGVRNEYVDFAPVDRPRFGYAGVVVDRDGNGDGVLNPGEKADMVFAITNVGKGDAPRVMASIGNRSGENLYLRTGRETIGDGIKAGASKSVRFSVERRAAAASAKSLDTALKIEFSVFDLAVREYLAEEIVLPSSDKPGPAFVAKPGVVRTVKPGVRLFAAASVESSTLASVPEGATLRSTGFFPGFFKVDMADGIPGFVVSTDVMELLPDTKADTMPSMAGTDNVAPLLDIQFSRADGISPVVRIRGRIGFFGKSANVRRKVLVFRENDKVYFWTGKGGTDTDTVEIDTTVRLQKGRNSLAVYAIEGKDRSSVRRYSIFQPGEVAIVPVDSGSKPGSGLPAGIQGF